MRIALPLALAGILVAGAAGPAAASSLTYDEARALAAREKKPLLVDFYATWCGPCKAFTKAAESDPEVQKALESVVLCKVDAEKEGVELAKAERIQGFPTYVLMNADGVACDRWMGYEKAYFLGELQEGLSDLTPIETKLARFDTSPTADGAVAFAEYHETRGEYADALKYLDRAAALDASRNLAGKRFTYVASGFLRQDLGTLDDVRTAADAVTASGKASTQELLEVVWQMKQVGQKAENPALVAPYVAPALAATAGSDDAGLQREHASLQIDNALYVTGDKAEAVRLKRASLPEGWKDDASALNGFAWWCFENGANLEEAEALARRGIELAPPGEDRAAILDTAAEICNARGNCDDAVELIRRAVAESPGRDYYKKQLARFEEIRATRTN